MLTILLICWIIPILFHYILFYIIFKCENKGETTTIEDLLDYYSDDPFGCQWPVFTPGVNMVILLLEIGGIIHVLIRALVKTIYEHIKDYKV